MFINNRGSCQMKEGAKFIEIENLCMVILQSAQIRTETNYLIISKHYCIMKNSTQSEICVVNHSGIFLKVSSCSEITAC